MFGVANVAYGSKATVWRCPRYFCFTPENRHSSQGAACLKGAKKRPSLAGTFDLSLNAAERRELTVQVTRDELGC